MSNKEVELTKGIPNETVCSYFYAMFIVISAVSGIAFLYSLWTVSKIKASIGIPLALQAVVTFAIAVANSLFLYVMCARSLLK